MSALRQTAVCGTCGWVGYADEQASHRCSPRRVAELERQLADLQRQHAALERRLTLAEKAWALAAGIRGVPDMLTPGTTQACDVVPLVRAARPSQVTGRPGRTAKRTPGRDWSPVTVLPRRAPAGGAA